LLSHFAVMCTGGFGALHVASLYVLYFQSVCMGLREHVGDIFPGALQRPIGVVADWCLVVSFFPMRLGWLPIVIVSFVRAVLKSMKAGIDTPLGATAAIAVSWAVLAGLSGMWTVSLVRGVARRCGVSARFAGSPRLALLAVVCWLQGRPVHFLGRRPSDAELAAELLRSSVNKGRVIEERLGLPAWKPLRPVESVDGTEWRHGADAVARLLRELQWQDRLPAILDRCCAQALSEAIAASASARHDSRVYRTDATIPNAAVIDATVAALTISRIMHELVFREPPSRADAELWVLAAGEYKCELAMRGWGSRAVKAAACSRASALLARQSDALLSASAAAAELSRVLQPFIISPIINIGDGLASLSLAITGSDGGGTAVVTEEDCLAALIRSPPFPILERVYEPTAPATEEKGECSIPAGAHVFILSDELAASLSQRGARSSRANAWLAFGAGPRACPGQRLALSVMAGIAARLRCFESGRGLDGSTIATTVSVRLWVRHEHSGRHNDAKPPSLRAIAFQAWTVARVLGTCALERLWPPAD
jgi:hypothetical protein